MPDVWPQVERWNAARDLAQGNPVALALLERHAVWMYWVSGEAFCDGCDGAWPCVVFTELETVLREAGK